MQLTDSDILEFQEMCKEHLGLKLSWEATQEQAIKLVRVMQLVHRPMTVEEFGAIKQHDKLNENENEQETTRSS